MDISIVPVIPVFYMTVVVAIIGRGVGQIRNRRSQKSADYGDDLCES